MRLDAVRCGDITNLPKLGNALVVLPLADRGLRAAQTCRDVELPPPRFRQFLAGLPKSLAYGHQFGID